MVESACNSGDLSSIPGSGRSPGEGNGNSLQYCCLKKSHGWKSLWATVHRVSKSQTRLSDFTFTFKQDGLPCDSVVKNLPANDTGSTSGLGSSPGKENVNSPSIFAWEISGTEDYSLGYSQ